MHDKRGKRLSLSGKLNLSSFLHITYALCLLTCMVKTSLEVNTNGTELWIKKKNSQISV